MLKYCLNTIREYKENDIYDIMVMCDGQYLSHVLDECNNIIKFVHITPPNTTCMDISIRKTEIGDFEGIKKYEKVLYLDSDLVILGPLQPIFDQITRDDVLYVVPEDEVINSHMNIWFERQDQKYTSQEMEEFRKRNIKPFNAGQFGFKVTDIMLQHFSNIARDIQVCFNPQLHFYEQCFLNSYFNRLYKVDYSIEPFCKLNDKPCSSDPIIHHFPACLRTIQEKLNLMKESFERNKTITQDK